MLNWIAEIKTLLRVRCWRAFKNDHLCALNFDQALAVIKAGNDNGSVNIAFYKVYQHFLSDSRKLYTAPVVTGSVG